MKIFFTLFALMFSTLVSAKPINKIVVFGDSLSDNGNFYEAMQRGFPVYPYAQGRFSNGPVWIEHVSEAKQVKLENYAFGGAGVIDPQEAEESSLFNLHKEVNNYLSDHDNKADDESLYVIWIGSNNYLTMPEDQENALGIVLNGIDNELRRLQSLGAKHFLVVDLPDLGRTPVAYENNTNEWLSVTSNEHNYRLLNAFNQNQIEFPDSDWVFLPVGNLFADLFLLPEKYGFASETIKDTCYDKYPPVPEAITNPMSFIINQDEKKDPCEGYLFFDSVHPTALAHKVLAEKSVEILDSAGIEFAKKTEKSA